MGLDHTTLLKKRPVNLAVRHSYKSKATREEEVVVKLHKGSVRGVKNALYGRRFIGIRYGTARRFRNPEIFEIDDEYDARYFRESCKRFEAAQGTSEQCLHLNIFTPSETKAEELGSSIPVAVWFHGGSFTMGAGSDTHVEDVWELVESRGLLVVTINYRLGIFGFLGSERLRLGLNDSVGNFGTLDQQMALRWVKRNIGYFGGDPDRIALVGWSAGAASISDHLSMPSSAGLFSRAIMMSGGFTDWAAKSMKQAEYYYDRVLNLTGCEKSRRCQEKGPPCPCLLSLTAEQLLEAQQKEWIDWAPTVDGTHLPKHPAAALAAGEVLKGIPIMIGGTMEDSMKDIGANATVSDFQQLLASKHGGLGVPKSMVNKAKEIYLQNFSVPGRIYSKGNGLDRWSPAYWAGRVAAADTTMNCVARRAAKLWQAKTDALAYWYVWSNYPTLRYPDPPPQDRRGGFKIGSCWPCPGATHGSDTPYLFAKNNLMVDDYQHDLAVIYQVFIRDMIFFKDPNEWRDVYLSQPEGKSNHLKKAWEPMPAGGMAFQDRTFAMDANLKSTECDFWDRVVAAGAAAL
jgi:carboxylesterase type B